jgi:hypothetical protein
MQTSKSPESGASCANAKVAPKRKHSQRERKINLPYTGTLVNQSSPSISPSSSHVPFSLPKFIDHKFCQYLAAHLSEFQNAKLCPEFLPCYRRHSTHLPKMKKMMYSTDKVPVYTSLALKHDLAYYITPCKYLNDYAYIMWQGLMLPVVRSGIHRKNHFMRIGGTNVSYVQSAEIEYPMGKLKSANCLCIEYSQRKYDCRLYFGETLPPSVISRLKLFGSDNQLLFDTLFVSSDYSL